MALDGKQGDMGNLHSLPLDEDEIEHLTKIEPEVSRMIKLAKRGAKLSLDGITDGCKCKTPIVGSSASIGVLFVVTAANLIKLATIALSLGYYHGCFVLLRAAFEKVAYLFFFIENPDEIELWRRFQLHPTLDSELKKQMKADKRDQLERAKIEFWNRMCDQASRKGAAQKPGQIDFEEIEAASYLENNAVILSSMSLILSHWIADVVFLSQDILEVGNANLKKDFQKWHGDVKK